MPDDVLLYFDAAMIEHDTGPGHPERSERLVAIRRRLDESPVAGTAWAAPRPAPRAALERVHAPAYVDFIDALRGRSARLEEDTPVSAATVDAAYLSAGAALDAVTAVVRGRAPAAFTLARPPGHHAEREVAMGFCLFNNIAVAAAHARAELGCERVLIVDWDVHHGNGTQNAFYDRRDVLFFSAHESPQYPGTGDFGETGTGDGAGFTVNAPMPAGLSDAAYRAIFESLLVPIADDFAPDLVLVSAGFDAHRSDPLGHMAMTEAGFATLCALVRDIAVRHAGGRLVLVLEGGYDVGALAGSVRACVEILAGGQGPEAAEPGGAAGAEGVIRKARSFHAAFWPALR